MAQAVITLLPRSSCAGEPCELAAGAPWRCAAAHACKQQEQKDCKFKGSLVFIEGSRPGKAGKTLFHKSLPTNFLKIDFNAVHTYSRVLFSHREI